MTSLMNKLLGHSVEIEQTYRKCKDQINSLLKTIKRKVEEKDDEALMKYNDNLNALLSQDDIKHQSTQPTNININDIPLKHRPTNGQLTQLNAKFELQATLRGHSDKIYALQWSSDSKYLVSGSQDGSLVIWDMSNQSYSKRLGIPLRMSWVMTVAYSPDGNYVASGGLDNLCSIFNICDKYGWASGANGSSSAPHRELQQHEGYVSSCKFIDNNHILTASGDSSCIYWDIEYQQPLSIFIGHSGDVDSVAHNIVTNNTFVSGSIDTTAKIWDYRTQKCINTFSGHVSDVNCVKWFPDYMSFGTASDDGCCRLFDLKSYQTINIYGNKLKEAYAVTSIDFSKSGYYLLASYDDGPMCLSWNTVTAKEDKLLPHTTRVSSLEFAPNGNGCVTGCWDKNLRLWV